MSTNRSLSLLAAATAAALLLSGCQSSEPKAYPATLEQIIDGDTFKARVDEKVITVRILGIDAPEIRQKTSSVPECGAEAARDRLYTTLKGAERLELVSDSQSERTDRYDRALRHVRADGVNVGKAMISTGYAGAWVPEGEPNPDGQEDYERAYRDAQRIGTGMNAQCDRLGRGAVQTTTP